MTDEYRIRGTEHHHFNITFHGGGVGSNSLGQLYEKDGKLHFKGDVDGSAKIFFDHVIKLFEEHTNGVQKQ